MRAQRQVVDYALRRRALLREVYSGRVGTYEVCDASPYLQSAARFHGEPTEQRCPVCRREHLTHVHYIYGDELKNSAGQARRVAELPQLAMTFREVQVYVVEVCRGCGWNYLVEQYVLGRDGLAEPLPAAASVGRGRADGVSGGLPAAAGRAGDLVHGAGVQGAGGEPAAGRGRRGRRAGTTSGGGSQVGSGGPSE
jgi:uncharacterized protein DUF5318